MGCPPNPRAAAARRSLSRPVMATRAPLAARDCAMARPMPLLPPVTNAAAFFKFIFSPGEIEPCWNCTGKGVTAEPTVFNSKSGELPYVKQAEEHLSRLELLPNENDPLDVACFTTKRQSRLN